MVGHVVNGLGEGSQVLHAYALPGTGEEVEQAVATAAHNAALSLLTEAQVEWARKELGGSRPIFCPVPTYIANVELVGIARLVHRPHTSRTTARAANFLHRCE